MKLHKPIKMKDLDGSVEYTTLAEMIFLGLFTILITALFIWGLSQLVG